MSAQNDIYLQNIPIINKHLNYKIQNNIVSINIENKHRIQRVFRKLGVKVPEATTYTMDEYSSIVFQLINGQDSIYQIGQVIQLRYPELSDELYERLVAFIDLLETNSWILFKNKMK